MRRPCSHCGELVADSGKICSSCGRPADDAATDEAISAQSAMSGSDTPASVLAREEPNVAPPPTASARRPDTLFLAIVAVAVLVVGVAMLALLPSPEVTETPHDSPLILGGLGAATAPSPAVSEVDTSAAPTWIRPSWADYVDGVTAFELRANSSVQVATRRLWPTLGISCASGTTGVYVVTGGAARIEPDTSDHLVRIVFDGKLEPEQRWLPAEDYQVMFAPDAIAVARQMVDADTLRVKFAHYQFGEAVVDFNVSGSEEYVSSVARRCRWQP